MALQFIGSIPVAGLTPGQARARIEAMYADGWFKKPQVAVNVVEYARATITVTGQVNRPGTFALSRNRSMTLLEAIGTAGHFKNTANQKRVLLKRGVKPPPREPTVAARGSTGPTDAGIIGRGPRSAAQDRAGLPSA